MSDDEHVEVCFREEKRWEWAVSVRHEWPHHYDLERMIEDAEYDDQGVRRNAESRERALRRALWKREDFTERFRQERRAKTEPLLLEWDTGGKLEGIVRARLRNDGRSLPPCIDQDDLVQIVRMFAWRGRHLFTPRTSIGAWVSVIARNVVRRVLDHEHHLTALLGLQCELLELELEGRGFITTDQWDHIDAILSDKDAVLLFIRFFVDDERSSSLTKVERNRVSRAVERLSEKKLGSVLEKSETKR